MSSYLVLADSSAIQKPYLGKIGQDTTIRIVETPTSGNDYPESQAQDWENHVVRAHIEFLANGWLITEASPFPGNLKDLIAMETAAWIGVEKLGIQFGSEGVGWWTGRYKGEVEWRMSGFMRNFESTDFAGIIKRTLTPLQRFQLSLMRYTLSSMEAA